MTISMMAMAKLSEQGTNGLVALIVGFAVGLLCGALIGFFVTRFKLQPFIVTLAALYVYKALELWYTGSANVRGTDISSVLKWTGNTITIGSTKVPYGAIIMLVAFAIMAYALRHTAWGRHVYATGDDREAARLAGIRTDRVLLSVYIICGLLCALAGWVLIGRNQGGDPQAVTKDYNLDSIVAVVIGGTSLFGGRGRVIGTLIGALTIGVFRSGLPLAGVEDIWKDFAIGVLILGAVIIDQWVRRVAR
jgi:fructose transport system permease protein